MKHSISKLAPTLIAIVGLNGFCSSVEAAQGNLYSGGENSHNIYKFTTAGVPPTVFYTNGMLNADSLAFDSKGNLFVADAGTSSILKITPAGVASTFATTIAANGLAFDAAGNLYASDAITNSIFKYTPTGAPSTFKAGLAAPIGLAFDTVGNLFVSLNGNGTAGSGSIAKIAPNGTLTTFATNLFVPQGLAVDNAGNVYEADLGSSSIFKFTSTGVKTTFASGLIAPRSLALDRFGNVFVGEFGANRITKITSAGVKSTFSQGTFVGGLAFEPPTSELTNISTRASVQTGDREAIAGFIIRGTAQKNVLVRGLGPTLGRPPFNVPGALQDPELELHNAAGATIRTNDDWMSAPNSSQIPPTFRPPDPHESAILISTVPGNYTAILAGKNNTTGIGLAEVYDMDSYSVLSELVNVSTRAFVGTNASVTIGGFISSGGNSSVEVVIRGLGPTLGQPPFNVPGALADPTLKLVDKNGVTIASNNNWQDSQKTLIQTTGFAPPNASESAIVAFLNPNNYTAILSGNGGGTGIGLVEVYKVLR